MYWMVVLLAQERLGNLGLIDLDWKWKINVPYRIGLFGKV